MSHRQTETRARMTAILRVPLQTLPQICDNPSLESILCAFAVLRKATALSYLSVCLSVCLSVRPSIPMEQLSSNWTDFHEICYSSILQKHVEEIQVTLECDKNNGYFTWTP
jgi:hypothetical protein